MTTIPNILLCLALVFFAFVRPLSAEQEPEAPPSMLIVEPHMVQIILNDEHRQGVDWEAIVSDFHALPLKEGDDSALKQKVSVGVVSSQDYEVLLDALDAVGQLSSYTMEPVTLNVDDRTNIEFKGSDNKENIAVAAILSMNSKGGRYLVLSPRVGGKTGSTSVDLKEQSTIVIGSIFSEREVTKTRKFPLLGDIPLVGLVFRNKGKLMQRTETVIFLSSKG